MKEFDYRIAFSFEGYYDKELKNDPRYVKVLARIRTQTNGEVTEKVLNFHLCTIEDYNEFYPVAPKSKQLLDEIRQDEKRGFYCLDWE